MKAPGKKNWAFSGGRIPLLSTGREPECCSHDKIAVLNVSETVAHLEITVFYEAKKPVGTYQIKVNPQRLRKIRFNDLIDPAAISLDENYGCIIKSNIPVVIQFSSMDTGIKNNARCTTMAFFIESDL